MLVKVQEPSEFGRVRLSKVGVYFCNGRERCAAGLSIDDQVRNDAVFEFQNLDVLCKVS